MPEESPTPHESPLRRVELGERLAGERLDVGLARALGRSRAAVRRLLAAGAIRVREDPGASTRPASLSEKGRLLGRAEVAWIEEAASPEHERVAAEPQLALPILGRGSGWLALDKPPGMAVHPLSAPERGTALGFVASLRPAVHGVGEGGLRSGVVHRLDLGTSGALLFATEQAQWERLRGAFAGHRVAKTYRALVAGSLRRSLTQRLGLYVARHRPARVRVCDVDAVGRHSGARVIEQRVIPVEHYDGVTLVEARPVTGFLHQIRVCLAHLGHPILGDPEYAPPEVAAAAPRPLLHAARVAYEEVEVHAPDAPDFAAALDRLEAARA